ncbi:MAG: GAF domain-containing protein [Chloroflexota bacterium]
MGPNEDFYQSIFNTTTQGVFQFSTRGTCLRVNSVMAKMFSYETPSEMIKMVKSVAKQVFAQAESYKQFKNELEQNNAVQELEVQAKQKDGTIFWISITAQTVRDAAGKVQYYFGFVRNLNQRELIANPHRLAEVQFRTLVEQSPVAVYIEAPQDNLHSTIYISPQIETITGYVPAEWKSIGFWYAAVHPENQKQFAEENEHTNATGEPFDMEYQIVHRDGHTVWVRDLAKLTRDANGNPLYWQGTLIDITDQKKLQASIRQSEDRFRKAFQASPIATCITTLKEGLFLDVNEAYLRLSGFQRDQIVGRTATEMIFLDARTRETWIKEFTEAGFSMQSQSAAFTTASGQQLEAIAFYEGIQVDGKDAILSMFYDITNQRRAEIALKESESRYRALVEHIPAIFYMDDVDKDQTTIYISPQVETITGYTPREWTEDPHFWENHIHPDDRKRVTRNDTLTNQSGKPFSEEYRFITKGGREIWIQEESTLIRDDAGTPLFWQGFMLDITSKKEAQTALGEIASAYRGLFDSVTDAIYIQDWAGRFLDVNLGAVNMYGYPREFFLGKTPDFLSAPGKNDMEALKKALERAFEGKHQQLEFWGLRKNGEIFPKDLRLYKGSYFGQKVIFAIARDITDRRKAQDARERQLKELSILHTLATEVTRAADEDQLIEKATEIIGYTLYTNSLGFLMVSEDGANFYPHPSYKGRFDPEKERLYPVGRGVAGRVITNGKPLNIHNVHKIKNYIEISPSTKSELCVPMKIGKRVIGVINVESDEIGFFTPDDERLLVTIAGQVATGIERLRTERAEHEQRVLAEALREIASALNSTLDFNTVMDLILENIDRVVPSETAMIMLVQNGVAIPIRQRGFKKRGLVKWINDLRLSCEEIPDIKRAVTTYEPQLISDTASYPEWVGFPETRWIRSYLLAPIIAEKKVIGLIALNHYKPGFFTKRDADRLMAFANQAASAIENARLFEEESRRARIIEALAEIANVIATSREIAAALDEIAERSLKLLNARNIAIYLLQDDNKTLKIVTAKGTYKSKLLSHTIRVGDGITGDVVATGKPEIVTNMLDDRRRIRVPGTPEKDSEVETMMSAPLILREKPIGAINAWRLRTNGLFNETELNFLIGIAHQVSIAIESGRMVEEISRRARETAAIAEVGRDISSTLKLDVVLERIAAYAKDLLRAETSAVYLTQPSSNQLRAIAAIGVDTDEIKSDPIWLGTGILGNIATRLTGEIVNDTISDPRAITIKGTESIPFEHIMGVPVLTKSQLMGLLVVWRIGEGLDFKPTELSFLDSLAQQAAIAIENARLFHAEQQRRIEAETLREAMAVVATTLERERAIELILNQLERVLKYDSASIQLLREGYLEIVGGRGWQSEMSVLGLRFPIPGNNPNTVVIQERRPVILSNTADHFEPFRAEPHSHIRSWLGAPLIAHGNVIGMLSVDSVEEGYFSEEHIRLVTAYANQAAIAIDNAQLHEKSENQIRRLTALRDVDTAIASSLDLRVTLNILMDNAASQLRADAMSILIYNNNLQILETVAALGFQGGLARRQFRIGEGLAGRIAITRQPLHIKTLQQAHEYSRLLWLADEKFVSYIGYPLIGKGQVKGVMEAYFRSPFSPDTDWQEFMQTMAGQAAIAIDNAQLFENLQRSNQELSLAYDTTLEGWGKALELRDKETQGHTRRVVEMTVRLARRMNISDSEITHIYRGVLLHDIGKMGVPDQILHKTGPLNESEWEQMRRHPQYAYDLLFPIAYLRPALDIPYCHHEKWDGTGYPRGIKGEEIPLAARIFAIVDVWDALLSDRPYRKTWTKKETIEYILRESGTRFDPKIVKIFLEMMSEAE